MFSKVPSKVPSKVSATSNAVVGAVVGTGILVSNHSEHKNNDDNEYNADYPNFVNDKDGMVGLSQEQERPPEMAVVAAWLK